MDLSIVIVNFNTKDLTLKCIKSIKNESGDLSFEVVLVDNGSSDASVEAFKKIREESFWRGKLTLIFNSSNLGYAKANNQGIKRAKGKYILLLNSDTVIHRDALQNLLHFAKDTPEAGVVGSKLLNTDGTLQMSCYRFPTIANAIKEYWFGQKGLFEKFAPAGKKPITVDSVVGAAFLITPEAVRRVGVLDERYFAYFEDIDYCRRVWKKGLKVYYLPASVITHYHGATFKKLADEKNQWKKLIPGSKIYHGAVRHYILSAILWIGQKRRRNEKVS